MTGWPRAIPCRSRLSGNGEEWTYAELDRRTNQVARAILDRTVPGRGCVAYLVGHSPAMVICALAALKAGKAYLCLHPAVPLAAQRDIVRDAAPDLLLTDAANQKAARDLAGDLLRVVDLEGIDARASDDPCDLPIDGSDPAAIFYTSGSTGRPKGVVKATGPCCTAPGFVPNTIQSSLRIVSRS